MHQSAPALLYESSATDIVLLDIPASLSAPPGRVPRCVHQPPAAPYTVPEPRAQSAFTRDLARAHDRLRSSLLGALEHVHQHHDGPICHPRTSPDEPAPESGQELDFHAHIPFLQLPDSAQEPLALEHDTTFSDISDILSVPVISSSSSAWTALTLSHPYPAKTFHIPPGSSFLLSPFQSSIATFTALAEQLQLFHFILLDPPWPNRSAARSHTYSTLSRFDTNDLLSLPIASALAHPGIVAIWITNKPKYRTYVLNTLFPRWGVVPTGEWIWLKTTTAGEPVFDLECSTRKPYEVLLFAQRPGAVAVPAKTILAVPDLHSRKPCVKALVEPFLPGSYRACEIFGRNLTEGWFTWGDEALKFNWEGHWTEEGNRTQDSSES